MQWRRDIAQRLQDGFSDDINGEDEFDAVVGLLGMIAVVTGAMESGEPTDDAPVTSVEGWILGRMPPHSMVVDNGDSLTTTRRTLPELRSDEQRQVFEEIMSDVVRHARSVGYTNDGLQRLMERVLSRE